MRGWCGIMAKNISKVKEIDVAAVEGSKTLAAGVDRRALERCKDTIEKLGILHTPVVGTAKGGNHLLLSGQCELTALRELGVKKMDAIEVEVSGDGGARAKLSLLLLSLWDKPGALCEGLLLQEAVSAGVSRAEIQIMLGKSASWVSNRLALVTRLDRNVYEMVRGGLLEARSAQEVARLPAQAQFAFAEAAVREGLPKSAIESLVAGYNDSSCPDAVKTQMLSDPRAALKRMADKRRAVNKDKPGCHKENVAADVIDEYIKSIRMQIATLRRIFFNEAVFDSMENRVALKGLEAEVLALLSVVRKLISPGKMEVGQSAG
jgi:ParB-like chromosome segregation protein Spo0J